MQDIDRDHLIEALDERIKAMEEDLDAAEMELEMTQRALNNLYKQRREVMA